MENTKTNCRYLHSDGNCNGKRYRVAKDSADPPKASSPLRLFVYGTLKRGYWNHDRYCRGATSIEEANVLGQLREFPSGIPVLDVPEESVLAVGTDDHIAYTVG